MHTFISMLRGINLGSRNKIGMPALKDVYESLHFANVVTYVQSGNVVFDCEKQDTAEIAASIEAALTPAFGFSVPVLIRDEKRFRQLIDGNPFSNQRHEDPTRLHVAFLSAAPSESALSKLAVLTGLAADEFLVEHKEIYLFCPNGYGITKLSNNFFERKLGVSATTRNWKTVNALYNIVNQR
jgi:uncharacterized protein (DUF1697 family)